MRSFGKQSGKPWTRSNEYVTEMSFLNFIRYIGGKARASKKAKVEELILTKKGQNKILPLFEKQREYE